MTLQRSVTRTFGAGSESGAALRVVIYARRSAAGGTSTADQVRMGQEDAGHHGWAVVAVHAESGQSASMYRKDGAPRAEWAKVLDLVAAGAVDLVWVRETSRADRQMATWAPFLDELRRGGVGLYVQADRRLYDLSVWRDHKTLLEDGIDNADESAKKSKRVKDGVDDNVRSGKPTGAAPLGYRNVYDPRTRKLTAREVDPAWSAVASEMFDRVGRGDSLASVARWLNGKGAPVPRAGKRWDERIVRTACENRAYLAERVHTFFGDEMPTTVPQGWRALVSRAQWTAAQNALQKIATVHAVRGRAPGAYSNLMSFTATCGLCGAPVAVGNARGVRVYVCSSGSRHAVVNQQDTDDYVMRLVVARMARPDLFASLTAADNDVIRKAEAEVEGIEAELAELGAEVKNRSGRARLAALDAIDDLEIKLGAARERLEKLAVPASLRELAHGAREDENAVRANWEGMTMAARRDAVRSLLAYFRVLPAPVVGVSPRTGKPMKARGIRGALDPRRVEHDWRDFTQPAAQISAA
ncbi:recombinase family protein [Pseudofrankia saprophytica]|uniref:recombinase family protein n=1 Tax=Pseudofrankia saprophytica TaxID=298655 RepID=UPI0018E3EE55|nr:recombinase family protein [Pseudofrankia saprophytica]